MFRKSSRLTESVHVQAVALNGTTKRRSRCPGFVFAPSTSYSTRKLGYLKPDVCCYARSHLQNVEAAASTDRTEFGYAELFIEVKPDPSQDFFIDTSETDDDDFLAMSQDEAFVERRWRAFGQHIMYATEMLARQHRIFLFSISMSGSRARFLRWDRAGCVVSAAFDVRQDPQLLCDFIWRFSQTNDVGRGHDPTVSMVAAEEEILFRDTIRGHVRSQTGLEGAELDRALSEHYQPAHVAAVLVSPHGQIASSENMRRFLVSRPVVSPLHLTGRATRGHWAVDQLTCKVVFLKDTWRSSPQPEGVIIQELHERGVRNIPSLVCHGDVPGGSVSAGEYCLILVFRLTR